MATFPGLVGRRPCRPRGAAPSPPGDLGLGPSRSRRRRSVSRDPSRGCRRPRHRRRAVGRRTVVPRCQRRPGAGRTPRPEASQPSTPNRSPPCSSSCWASPCSPASSPAPGNVRPPSRRDWLPRNGSPARPNRRRAWISVSCSPSRPAGSTTAPRRAARWSASSPEPAPSSASCAATTAICRRSRSARTGRCSPPEARTARCRSGGFRRVKPLTPQRFSTLPSHELAFAADGELAAAGEDGEVARLDARQRRTPFASPPTPTPRWRSPTDATERCSPPGATACCAAFSLTTGERVVVDVGAERRRRRQLRSQRHAVRAARRQR